MSGEGRRRASLLAACVAAMLAVATEGYAFPPYRSTDAETAAPWTFEPRLGLLRVERESGSTEYTAPLLRANLGLPYRLELVSELEYRADEERVADAAAGFKWAMPAGELAVGTAAIGIETLALLPNPGRDEPGVQSLLLATLTAPPLRLHLNGGGFHDPAPPRSAEGWRGSLLGEVQVGRLRPGWEVFARQRSGESAELASGPGLIVDFGGFDLRTGLQFGVTERAPDLATSLWITTKLPLSRSSPPAS